MYSTHNEEKFVVAETFTRTLNNKIYNHLSIVYEQNNTYHRIIKMKPVDVKNNTYIKFGKDVNDNIVGMPYPLIKGEQDLPKIESFGVRATKNFARKGG